MSTSESFVSALTLPGEEKCGNEINTLQRLLDHVRPRPNWSNATAEVLGNVNQLLLAQEIRNMSLANQVRTEATSNLTTAVGRFSTVSMIETTQDPVPGLASPETRPSGSDLLATRNEHLGAVATTQAPIPAFSSGEGGCGNGIDWLKWFVRQHRHKPQPWEEITSIIHCLNEALSSFFIADSQLAAQVRIEAAKSMAAVVNRLASVINTGVATAA